MAELIVDGSDLVLHMPFRQKFAGIHGDIRVPLTAVRSVRLVENPWLARRGWRMAGTGLPGVISMGTWRHGDGYDFYILRKEPYAVAVDVASGRFARLMIGHDDEAVARAEVDRIADAAGIAAG